MATLGQLLDFVMANKGDAFKLWHPKQIGEYFDMANDKGWLMWAYGPNGEPVAAVIAQPVPLEEMDGGWHGKDYGDCDSIYIGALVGPKHFRCLANAFVQRWSPERYSYWGHRGTKLVNLTKLICNKLTT